MSRNNALRENSSILLPDFEQLAEAIRKEARNRGPILAIIGHQKVAEPILDMLREAGVHSLRTAASMPTRVDGGGPMSAPSDLLSIINELRSPKVQNIRKHLAGLDFPTNYLREHWKIRVQLIKGIRISDCVNAEYELP